MSDLGKILLFAAVLSLTACGGGSGDSSSIVILPPQPVLFHCTRNSDCPEILVAGDPLFTGSVAPFTLKGYGDPSLEHDPNTGALWMSYSWLETLVDDVNHPDIFDLGVSIHLARSDDGGDTWAFEREMSAPEQETHPDTLERGYSIHEVSTIVRGGPLGWELLWFKYFTPLGADNSVTQRSEFLYFRSDATDPRDLGVTSDVWARGASTSDSWGAPVNLSDIADVSDCVAFTEPSLLRFNDRTFVVMLCSFEASIGNPFDPERVVLFEEVAGDYRYVADVMDGIDAEEFDADFLASPDISIARDGTVILIVTPVDLDATPQKSGCIVFEFADFENGLLLRDTDDSAIPRTIITSDGDNPGPGLCTYSAQSSTGVLLIMHDELVGGSGLEFSLRATGVHP